MKHKFDKKLFQIKKTEIKFDLNLQKIIYSTKLKITYN